MTENEAIEKLHAYLECESRRAKIVSCNESCDDCELCYMQGTGAEHITSVKTAIKALEEVQQYRQIGSVELFAETKKLSDLTKKCGTIGNVFDECAEYAAIGTVEECREAVEKQTAKKPEFVDTRFMNNGKHISDGCQLQKCYKCPNCNQHIFHVWDDELYCKYCGQKIDWRNEE